MSRVTKSASTLVRGVRNLSSTPNAANPSSLLTIAARKGAILHVEGRNQELDSSRNIPEHHDTRTHSTLGGHRPSPHPTSRTVPLMQGFRTSAPRAAAHDTSTIDFFFLPPHSEPSPSSSAGVRVPLLPDNFNPVRSIEHGHAVEALDTAVPRPEISIVASHPENVVPVAMSEMVGNEAEDDIGRYVGNLVEKGLEKVDEVRQPGILRQLWQGFVEDVRGGKGGKFAV